jgi:hypothetical protein
MDIRSTPGLTTLVYRGNICELREFLASWPEDKSLYLADEPYCNIQGKNKQARLQIVCDDHRFVFDDLFIVRYLYFSTKECHNVVLNHPKFRAFMNGKRSIIDEADKRFHNRHEYMGMYQRYYLADRIIRKHQKRVNFRLAFHLYPFLKFYTRAWLANHYEPGNKGYLRSKKNWEAIVAAPPS